MKSRGCELCFNGESAAALYCPSDSASLCWNCDTKVHEDNFLVARHVRFPLCSKCNEPVTNNPISGPGFQPMSRICRLCSFESPAVDDLHSLHPSSSDCISYAESFSTPLPNRSSVDFDCVKIVSSSSVTELYRSSTSMSKKAKTLRSLWPTDSKVEDIVSSWCTKLGMSGMITGVAVPVAVKAFGACCSELITSLPSRRVWLAASLWLSLRLCGYKSVSTCQVLKRLEETSGVPAKLIVAWETKVARILTSSKKRFRWQQSEEGWAETSPGCV